MLKISIPPSLVFQRSLLYSLEFSIDILKRGLSIFSLEKHFTRFFNDYVNYLSIFFLFCRVTVVKTWQCTFDVIECSRIRSVNYTDVMQKKWRTDYILCSTVKKVRTQVRKKDGLFMEELYTTVAYLDQYKFEKVFINNITVNTFKKSIILSYTPFKCICF